MFGQEKAKPKDDSAVKRIQEIGKREAERKKKEKEEAAKKGTVNTDPSKGVLSRLGDMVFGAKKEKK